MASRSIIYMVVNCRDRLSKSQHEQNAADFFLQCADIQFVLSTNARASDCGLAGFLVLAIAQTSAGTLVFNPVAHLHQQLLLHLKLLVDDVRVRILSYTSLQLLAHLIRLALYTPSEGTIETMTQYRHI